MNLVEKQNFRTEKPALGINNLFDIFFARGYCRELVILGVESLSIYFCQSCFTNPGRSPENKGEKMFLRYGDFKWLPFSHKMSLANKLAEILRPNFKRQRFHPVRSPIRLNYTPAFCIHAYSYSIVAGGF